MARRKKNDPTMNLAAGAILIILFMPIVGLVLPVVGILLWLFLFL